MYDLTRYLAIFIYAIAVRLHVVVGRRLALAVFTRLTSGTGVAATAAVVDIALHVRAHSAVIIRAAVAIAVSTHAISVLRHMPRNCRRTHGDQLHVGGVTRRQVTDCHRGDGVAVGYTEAHAPRENSNTPRNDNTVDSIRPIAHRAPSFVRFAQVIFSPIADR
jgi:hypothetical protein